MNEQDKLHISAYLDGELESRENTRIKSLLLKDAEAEQYYQQLSHQKRALKQMMNRVLEEPLPESLNLPPARQTSWKPILPMVVSLAASLFFGIFIGWQVKPPVLMHQQQAFGAHLVYASEVRHPVEVDASQEGHLVTWLSKRLGQSFQAPDLARFGFELLGGRLLAQSSEPAAQLMYERSDGVRLSLYLSISTDGQAPSAFHFGQKDLLNAFFWSSDALQFALVGPFEQSLLLDMAHASYQQLMI